MHLFLKKNTLYYFYQTKFESIVIRNPKKVVLQGILIFDSKVLNLII